MSSKHLKLTSPPGGHGATSVAIDHGRDRLELAKGRGLAE
jgi:hypothetical protein